MQKINTTLFNILFVGVLITSISSCVDLEEDVSGILAIGNLNSESEIIAALTPMYREMQNTYAEPHFQRTATYGGDDITTWWAGNKEPLRVFDQFNYGNGENSDNIWLPYGWRGYWNTIYIANNIIEAMKTSTGDEALVNSAEGEARFMRALSYFHLVRIHGGMPLIVEGVPATGDETRASVLENYELIESDLLIAIDKLPAPSEQSAGRVSSAAARTALSSLYLTWGGWPVKDESKYALAAQHAKEVIDLGFFQLVNIEELWTEEGADGGESIFSLQFSETENINSGWAASFSFHESRGWSDIYPELQFFNDFPDGPRKDETFLADIPQRVFRSGVIVSKDPSSVPWQESGRKHPMYRKFTKAAVLENVGNRVSGFRAIEVFRYAEVLLIYAEAQARIGENASSIEALNQVKRRAAGLDYLTAAPSVDVTTATPNEIMDEAGWELAGEFKRWFDLVRSERVEEIAAKRDAAEDVQLMRQPGKDQYIAPLPSDAFLSGSKMVQNPEGFVIQ